MVFFVFFSSLLEVPPVCSSIFIKCVESDINVNRQFKVGGHGMHLITKNVNVSQPEDAAHPGRATLTGYTADKWVCVSVGMNMDWTGMDSGRIEAFCYVHNGQWYLQSYMEVPTNNSSEGRHRILCIPKKMFYGNPNHAWMNYN